MSFQLGLDYIAAKVASLPDRNSSRLAHRGVVRSPHRVGTALRRSPHRSAGRTCFRAHWRRYYAERKQA